MNILLFIFMLFVAGLLSLYVVKFAPIHTSEHNEPHDVWMGDKSSYEPRWEPSEPHGVWMGDKFFHALNPFVPGNPNWDDAKLGGYNEYFEVDLHKKTHTVEVYRQGSMMFVCIGILNQTNAQEFEFGFSNEHHRGWENVMQFLDIIDPDYIQVIE